MTSQSTAVICFQLGGPDSLDAVEPFLYNLFSDPDIFDFPGSSLFGKPLARWISKNRAPHAAEHYAAIGGRSPIRELTDRQAAALQVSLHAAGADAKVFVAMRYWHPMTDAVVQQVKQGGFTQIVLLPLYPQFSQSTTLSSVNEWRRQAMLSGLDVPTKLICCYPNHPSMIDAVVANINQTYLRFSGVDPKDIELVFSAHGVPLSYIKRGDPYQLQIEETVRAVVARGRWTSPHRLAYQSKVGPQKWLQPALTDIVEELLRQGRRRILIVPIAFVTEHIETLHEINIELREEAEHLGVKQLEMMPALNDHPLFIKCLTDLVTARMRSSGPQTSKCMRLWEGTSAREKPVLCPWME